NDAKILVGWSGSDYINAAEILRYTASGWEEKDRTEFERMLRTVFYPLIKDFFPEANGNWDGAMMHTMISMGVYLDDHGIYDRAVDRYLRGAGNGGLTRYVYPHGQSQESTRDQPHTQMGLDYLSRTAHVAWNQGLDLYETADNRLALGFEYTAKYMLGNEVFTYGGPISPQGRYRFRDNFEAAYQHYHYIKGLEMPYTRQAMDSTRSASIWGVLTRHKGPLASSPALMGPPKPSTQAPEAGARTGPTTDVPEGAIVVGPGGSIQDALDERNRTGGGWVILEKGIHRLPEALALHSGVTLAGQGLETILFLDPEQVRRHSAAIVNAEDDMHDVTLRDFVIEGATSAGLPDDPNQGRRQRAHQLNPSRAGVIFAAQKHGQMRNIRFEHVTVRNHTHNGVALYGAANVSVIASDFSDNGSSVVPGPGLQHNLIITRVTGCEVRDSRLDTSPWGSGIDISHSRNVTVTNSEAARNRLSGIRVTESNNTRIAGNLTEGNGWGGIVFDALMEGSDNIEILENLSRNNGGYGIDTAGIVYGTRKNNTLKDNELPSTGVSEIIQAGHL
ncbi:MAG: right-handed parallel beta-helix repeat-containing protein, partial [Balneolales bacterium]